MPSVNGHGPKRAILYTCVFTDEQASEALDSLTPVERHQWYKLLKLKAAVFADGRVEISWAGGTVREAVCETATLSPPGAL